MDPLVILAIGIFVVMGSILALRLHAFLALFLGAVVVACLTTKADLQEYAVWIKMGPSQMAELLALNPAQRIARGFGETCMKIGIVIAMASIIGKALLDSGAADRIIRSAVRLLGEKGTPLAFVASGFILTIPIFVDTVFFLLLPLVKSMGTRSPRNYLLYILSMVSGATMANALVPPAPGPLFVATAFKVPLNTMIVAGLVLGCFTSLSGYCYSVWANRRWPIPLRETPDMTLAELHALAAKPEHELPPFIFSIMPIFIPILLITVAKIKSVASHFHFLATLGDVNIAVAIGAAISLALLAAQKKSTRAEIAKAVQSALSGGGTIILIIAAGGAFGTALQQCGIGDRVEMLATQYQIAWLPFAFMITALVRTAQGSATVAMITAAGVLGGMANPETLGFNPVYLALAIGCGSKPFPWMNDAGFWVIGRGSGMTEAETLKTSSMTISIMGCVGILLVMAAAKLFPLI